MRNFQCQFEKLFHLLDSGIVALAKFLRWFVSQVDQHFLMLTLNQSVRGLHLIVLVKHNLSAEEYLMIKSYPRDEPVKKTDKKMNFNILFS